MRLVCRKWKSESDRVIKSRPPSILLRTEEDIHRIKCVMDKQKAVGGTPLFKNFLILFGEIHLEQEAVVQFLNIHGPSFEQLSLQFNWLYPGKQHSPQSLKYLLETQVPNLKSLQFFGFTEDLWQSVDVFKDCKNLLPNLEHIGCVTLENYRHARECPLYLSLFNRLPSVKKITINCSNYWDIILNQAVSANDNQLRKFFSEVEEINTGLYDDRILLLTDDLTEYPQPINVPKILKLLPQVCPKVRTLRLWYDSDTIPPNDVGNLLRKYSGQIEELWLNARTWLEFDNVEVNEDQPDPEGGAIPGSLINELLMTPVLKKIRVFRTGADILRPSKASAELFHKQMPMLQSLSLMYEVPLLAWNRIIQNSGLLKLQLMVKNAECMLPIGQAFPNIKFLCLIVDEDAGLQLISQAFPNLEELSVTCDSAKLSHDGLRCIGDLQSKCFSV